MADAPTGWRKLLRDLAVDFIDSGAAAKVLKLVEQSIMDVLAEENEGPQTNKPWGPERGPDPTRSIAYATWLDTQGLDDPSPAIAFGAGWEAREAQR